MEEYYVIFAERMIQHPAVKRVCESDFSFSLRGRRISRPFSRQASRFKSRVTAL